MSSLKKITREIKFNGRAWKLEKHANGIDLFFSEREEYAIIVDSNDNVLFELCANYDSEIVLMD